MFLLSDIITYVRRIVKTPSNTSLSDDLIIDYINRFWISDVDARIQLFDLKSQYIFSTTPGIDSYNMPLYGVNQFYDPTEPGGDVVGQYPVYQGFLQGAEANGIQIPFYTEKRSFWNIWPNYIQQLIPAGIGNGGTTYSLPLPLFPALAGHMDITGIIMSGSTIDPIITNTLVTQSLTLSAPIPTIPITSIRPGIIINATATDSSQMTIWDSGQFLMNNQQFGLLMNPLANTPSSRSLGVYDTTTNTVDYQNGILNVTFPKGVQAGSNINVSSYFYEQGLPRAVLMYNNTITIRPPPNVQYLIELDCYLTPAAFLNSAQAIPFGYMAEYIARGAARKILSDQGDNEQFAFYEPLFKEQETLVWKRSQRQFTSTRTGTIFSDLQGQNNFTGSGSPST
jgi:hypothetical protein